MPGKAASSVSNRPMCACVRPPSDAPASAVAVTPLIRLAPARLWSGVRPSSASIAAIMRVVVVLPLVPETSTTPRGSVAVNFCNTCGSIRWATTPGSVVPPPRRSMRLAMPADFPAATASNSRRSIMGAQTGYFPVNPWRAATTSAMILTAISSGESNPIFRPMGACRRASCSSGTPSARRRSRRLACVRGLPNAPT